MALAGPVAQHGSVDSRGIEPATKPYQHPALSDFAAQTCHARAPHMPRAFLGVSELPASPWQPALQVIQAPTCLRQEGLEAFHGLAQLFRSRAKEIRVLGVLRGPRELETSQDLDVVSRC